MDEMPEAPLSGEPAAQVPGYRVERLLGRGGFALVFAATSDAGERVALKLATAGDAEAAAQLHREEKALRAVGPLAAPALLASGTLPEGAPWLALELLQPPTLAERLQEPAGPMPRGEMAALAPALLDAVAAVHAAGFVHLDLKPANIFLTAPGVRLIDFGLARPLRERQAGGRAFAGTAEYASPEQCEERPDLDARADLYALGVLLFEMLAGRPPFTGAAQAVREAQVGLRPPRPSQLAPVPAALEQVVLRCLAKDRAQRFQTAPELKAALLAALAEDAPAAAAGPKAAGPEAAAPKAAGPAVAGPAVAGPAAAGPKAADRASSRALERRQMGLLLFSSAADPGSVQSAVRALGGDLGHAGRGKYAAIFPAEAGQDPVRRAFRAAQGLAERKLAVRALLDLGAVNAQPRADGTMRYLSPELGRDDRYPRDSDPLGPLATAAAAEVLAEVGWEPVPGRAGILAPRPGTANRLQTATVVQLGAGPLIGREDVLRALLSAAREATEEGRPTVAAVVAEPGHGKTHLAATLLEQLRSQLPGAELLDLRAREPVAGDADEALRGLLTRALELPPGAREDSGRVRFAAAVGNALSSELWPAAALTLRLVPPDDPRVRALAAAPGVLRSIALRAAGEALRARARRRPLCVVLDDAQFADDTALDALEYAALAEAKAPLFVCALGRPAFAEARKSFGERAARHQLHRVGPLDAARAAELCRRLLLPAENVATAAIDRLVQRTQGIPLLLVELVRGLKRDGLVRKRARGDSWFLATDELDALPDSPLIEWLAERELSALPRELASHARLAALLGAEFGAGEVDGVVSELDAEGLGADFPLDAQVATRRLAGLGLLVTTRTGAFRFRHSLVRDAVARSVPAGQRAPIHRGAARFYRATTSLPDLRRLPLLARHAAEAGLKEEAAGLYLTLAEDARGRHAYFDAERSYTSALAMLDGAGGQERLTARRGRGSMRYRIGRYEDAFADLESARDLAKESGDRLVEAEIVLDAATALDWVTDFDRSAALVAESERLIAGAGSPALQARLLLGKARALFRADRRAEACSAFQQAARLAEEVGDAAYETLIISLVMLESVLAEVGDAQEAGRAADRAISICRDRGDQLHLVAALNNRRQVLVARKDVAGAVEDQLSMMRIGRELGMLLAEYFGQTNLSELLYQAGDLDAAAGHARRAMEMEERNPEVASRGPVGVLRLARIEAYRGREPEARELLRRIDEALSPAQAGAAAPGRFSPSQRVLRDMVDLATRDATAAEWEALLERSSRESVEQEPIEVADLYGTWALRRGRPAEARRAFAEAEARAARIPNIMDARVKKGLLATGAPSS
jgi:tetratricopeptide (TPR) repeat protein